MPPTTSSTKSPMLGSSGPICPASPIPPASHPPSPSPLTHDSPDIADGPKNKQTVIIFDWDDTLLCSSYLQKLQIGLSSPLPPFDSIPPSFLSSNGNVNTASPPPSPSPSGFEPVHYDLVVQLRELEQSVVNILTVAIDAADAVHVVTNAEMGWVQLSAAKFLPRVLPLLSQVSVLSARSTWEHEFPNSPLKWKERAFTDSIGMTFGPHSRCTDRHVVSFGDSFVEREAILTVAKDKPFTKTKSVKFAERPSLEQLRRQLELVHSCFAYIHNNTGDLDLQLSITVNQVPASVSTPPSPSPSASISNSPLKHTAVQV